MLACGNNNAPVLALVALIILVLAIIIAIAIDMRGAQHDHFRGKDITKDYLAYAQQYRQEHPNAPLFEGQGQDHHIKTVDDVKHTLQTNGLCDVFSPKLVATNAAVVCDKGDPLNIPGGVFRVLTSKTIARYPSPPIASSWDPNWGAAVHVDCTGATAAPNMQMR